MKKIFAILLTCASLLLIGCNVSTQSETPTCSHHYVNSTTKNPTCKEEGVETYECIQCGKRYNRAIAKTTDHKYICSITKEATSENQGTKTYTCNICGNYYTKNFILSKVSTVENYRALETIDDLATDGNGNLIRLVGLLACSVDSWTVSQENKLTSIMLKFEFSNTLYESFSWYPGKDIFKINMTYKNKYDDEVSITLKYVDIKRIYNPGIFYQEIKLEYQLVEGVEYKIYPLDV